MAEEFDTLLNTFNGAMERVQDALKALIKWIKHQQKKRATHIAVKESKHGPDMEEGQMGKPLSNTDVRRLFLVPKDDKDKQDAVQDGSMKAVSTDDAICAVALDPQNQLEAILTPADGAHGMVTFTFTADADLGGGEVPITGEYSCEVVDQMATVIQVEEGEELAEGADGHSAVEQHFEEKAVTRIHNKERRAL